MEKNDERFHFTEEDKKGIADLPPKVSHELYMRLANLTMKRRIADDAWDIAVDEIEKELEVLVRDIKAAIVKNVALTGNFPDPVPTDTGKVYHPTREDFENLEYPSIFGEDGK